MLADEDAAVGDQLVGAFLLSGLVIPGTGEGHVHGDRGPNKVKSKWYIGLTSVYYIHLRR